MVPIRAATLQKGAGTAPPRSAPGPRRPSGRRGSVAVGLVLLLVVSSLAAVGFGTGLVPNPSGVASGLTPMASGSGGFPTPIHHVFVVMLENEKRSSVLSNGPFEKHLTSAYASASKYYAICHPSAPNYLAITSGSTWQCGSDGYTTHATENLGDLAQKAGRTWAGFEQSMPSACDTSNSYPYAVKHNPLVYYPDIVNNNSECQTHDVPFSNWTSDVSTGAVPNFGLFTPNLTDDGHDTSVAFADSWLQGWLSPLLNDTFFASSVFFIVYDESVNDNSGYNGTAGGNVYFSAVSPYAKAGYVLPSNASHYNLLSTIEWLLGLGSTGHNDTAAKWPAMKSLFNFSGASLTASASGTPTSGSVPLTVGFTGSAVGGTSPYTYAWKFGDGGTSTLQDPSHKYTSTGSYSASLTVTDAAKKTASGSVSVTVSKASTPISVTVSASPSNGTAPLLVNFSSTVSGGVSPYTYSWGFGGTATSALKAPSHTYLYAGTYTATLTVTDSSNASAKASVKITVTKGTGGLAAGATGSITVGLAPLSVQFAGGASGGTGPYTYDWTFGDGGTATKLNTTHTYSTTGTYVAQLKVVDASGSAATANVSVLVSAPVPGVAGSLVIGAQVAVTPGSFWSVDAQTSCATCIYSNASVTGFLGSTPFTWVRYGQGIDSCNISADRSYSASGVASTGCGFDLTSLKDWCDAMTPHCHAILGLPGENNNSHEDAAIARWVVQTIGFQPDYWAIGNEPTGWTHYGIPWTSWKLTDSSTPSAIAYAFDVKAAIAAVSAVDPGAKFIGLEAACSCNTAWFQDVAKVDGSTISAMAFHNYPSTGSTTETLQQFYAPLASSSNITDSMAAVRSAMKGQCSACATLPIFVNEYNAGPGWSPSNYGGTYANAVFLAASVTQALTSNISQMTVFNLQSDSSPSLGFALMDSKGAIGPTGLVYSGIFDHLADGTVRATRVSTSMGNVWAVTTRNSSTESTLVVNANLSHGVALSLTGLLVAGLLGKVYEWNGTISEPRVVSGTIQAAYSVPVQGILLVDLPLGKLLGPQDPVTTGPPAGPTAWGSGSPAATALLLAGIGGSAAGLVTVAAARRPSPA